jgi:hypothetical protein
LTLNFTPTPFITMPICNVREVDEILARKVGENAIL